MNGLKEVNVGVFTGRSAPIEIGIPFAVVFLIKKGIGLFFLSKLPSTSLELLCCSRGSACLLISNKSVTTTFGARDLVVIVLKRCLLIKFSHV